MEGSVYVVQDINDRVCGVYANLETAHAAADAAEAKTRDRYDVSCHAIDFTLPDEWIAENDRNEALERARDVKAKLTDDADALRALCEGVPRL